ncbi:MAG: B12-binding domain-containing radical SAM protein [Elusimicrobia bacterium]|nr:B12-binding domain-containing radical SAM protein [Candidatus Liberimonas magnetica]
MDRYEELMAEQSIRPLHAKPGLPSIGIVVPPSPFIVPQGWQFYLRQPFEGVSYIATVLKNAGYRVRIIDVRQSKNSLDEAMLQSKGLDILGISTFEDSFPFIQDLCKKVKERAPKTYIVLGGSLVTSVPEVVMANTEADIAVIGEGELTILELLEKYSSGKLDSLSEINGTAYKDSFKKTVINASRKQIEDLDHLPLIDFFLWPQTRKDAHLKEVLISHSRGCSNNCAFCYRPIPHLREKSVEKFSREVKELKLRHNFNFIYFVDLTFAVKKERNLEICEVLKANNVKWSCMTRVQNLDPETLRAMKTAGCEIILYGFESIDQLILDSIHKKITVAEIRDAIKMTNDAGIEIGGLFIIGFPGETTESLDKTVDFLKETGSVARVKYLSAIPGTEIYRTAVQKGLIKDELAHLYWLSRERGHEDDEFINFTEMPDNMLREAYKKIKNMYIKGLAKYEDTY